MFTTLTRIALCLTVSVAFIGCKASDAKHEKSDATYRALAEPVAIVDLHCDNGDEALASHMLKFISSQDQLDAIGSEALSAIEVDFETHNAILVTMGEKNTGGFWIMIDNIQAVGDTLFLRGTANAPGDGDSVTQALTYPFCLAIVEKGTPTRLRSDFESVRGQEMVMP